MNFMKIIYKPPVFRENGSFNAFRIQKQTLYVPLQLLALSHKDDGIAQMTSNHNLAGLNDQTII